MLSGLGGQPRFYKLRRNLLSLEQPKFSQLINDGLNGAHPASNKLHEEATEHTIAGSVVGAVRSCIPGIKGTASSNDQIARIAADTIASIPMVKTVAGGAIRATMLIDPTKSAEANATGFGLNFVEGMALNKVARGSMPHSGFSDLVASKFGTGLAAESVTHLTVGLGFGAVRTGFNTDSWKDSQGNFSIATGAENLLKGSATGALVNLPAGLIGFRVAKASSFMLESGALSPRLASVITGAGSGYAAGGVFGGLDAVMSGKSLPDVLKSINEGGIIGAASGGLMGSFDGSRLLSSTRNSKNNEITGLDNRPNFVSEKLPAVQEAAVRTHESIKPEAVAAKPQDAIKPQDATVIHENIEPSSGSRFVIEPARYEAMSIKPLEVPRIEEVAKRLTSAEVRPENYEFLDPQSKGPYKDYSDFASNVKTRVEDMRVYKVDGGNTEVALRESYAKELDAVRALRIKAEQPSILDNLAPGQHIAVQTMVKTNNVKTFHEFYNPKEAAEILPIVWARIKLAEHPLGNRALPEDMITLMDELPTRTNITRLTLHDEPWVANPWHSQDYKEGFQAAATAVESTGHVAFYQANRSDSQLSTFRDIIRGSLFHEHGHLVPPADNLYGEASLLEKDGYYVTEYSKRNDSERWAEDRSKAFLHPDVDRFLEMAEKAPIRSAVIAQELTKQMGTTPVRDQSVFAKEIWSRVKFTEEQVLPLAREQLVEQLGSKDARTQEAALRLLDRFGTKNEQEAVVEAAHNGSTPDIRRRAFDLATRLYSPDLKEQFNFVWEQGLPNMPARDLAIRRMRYFGTIDERAPSYANLLVVLGKNDLPGLAIQVTRMHTDEGSALAYDYAMNLGRHVEGYQRAVALSALQEVPSLRLRALQTLNVQSPEYIAPVVKNYVNDADPNVAAMAREVLKGVEMRTVIQSANSMLFKGGTLQPEEITALGNTGSSTAVTPLLESLIKGPEGTRPLTLDALAKFEPNIVKFYARLAKKDLTVDQAHNLELVTNYNFRQGNWQSGRMEQLKQTVH